MTDQFDPLWPHGHQTRDGREVVIHKVYEEGENPIHGAYLAPHGWHGTCWTTEGLHDTFEGSPLDLINKPAPPAPKRVGWLNIHKAGLTVLCTSRSRADEVVAQARSAPERIACIRVEYSEGQFDD